MAVGRSVSYIAATPPLDFVIRQGYVGGLALDISTELDTAADIGQWAIDIPQAVLFQGVVADDGTISRLETMDGEFAALRAEPSSVVGQVLVMIPDGFYTAKIAPDATTLPVVIAMVRIVFPDGETKVLEVRIAICYGDET